MTKPAPSHERLPVAKRASALPRLRRFIHDERGATAIEYALIAGFIFLGIAGALNQFASSTGTMYNKIGNAISP
jgi:pilus assembly protein Flp/PilA